MESRAAFKQISEYDLRSTAPNTIDTGIIPTPVTSTTTSGPANRGMEANTNRDGFMAPMITGITTIDYAPATIQPEVMPFKVREDI
jgi:hypothetical protein